MKTVYKKIAVVITALFVVSLSFLPFAKTAKATDDNVTTEGADYNFVFVSLPVQFAFRPLGTIQPYYVTGPLRFQIYNSKTFTTGTASTVDWLFTFANSAGKINSFMLGSTSIKPYFWFIPASGATSQGVAFSEGPTLNYTRATSETISGTLKSFTTGLYEDSNGANTGFFVTFNFEVGYKTYTFTSGFICEAYGQTLPLTTTIATISADGVASYNEGYNAGKTDGYNNGYTDGKNAGEGAGYNKGYSAGYNDGRQAPQYSFKEFFIGLGDAFVTIWTGMLNFEFLGVNIAGLIGTILVVCLVIFIVKIVKGA